MTLGNIRRWVHTHGGMDRIPCLDTIRLPISGTPRVPFGSTRRPGPTLPVSPDSDGGSPARFLVSFGPKRGLDRWVYLSTTDGEPGLLPPKRRGDEDLTRQV